MSAFVISLLVGAGSAAFIWNKLARSTGNADPTTTYLAAGGAGALVFLVAFVTLKLVLQIG